MYYGRHHHFPGDFMFLTLLYIRSMQERLAAYLADLDILYSYLW